MTLTRHQVRGLFLICLSLEGLEVCQDITAKLHAVNFALGSPKSTIVREEDHQG